MSQIYMVYGLAITKSPHTYPAFGGGVYTITFHQEGERNSSQMLIKTQSQQKEILTNNKSGHTVKNNGLIVLWGSKLFQSSNVSHNGWGFTIHLSYCYCLLTPKPFYQGHMDQISHGPEQLQSLILKSRTLSFCGQFVSILGL